MKIVPSRQFSYAYTESANYSSTNAVYEFLLWNKANISSYPTCGASIQLRAGNTSAGGGNITGVRRGGANQGDLAFSTTDASGNPVEKLRINSTGDIGINYSGTPDATLDIRTNRDPSNGLICFIRNNAQNGNGAFYGMDVNSVGTWSIGMPDNTNALSFRNGGQGNSGAEEMRLDGNGDLTVTGKIISGDSSGQPFFLNKTAVTTNTTVTSTYNWMSAGPMTINSGVTVTVNSGATWTVV